MTKPETLPRSMSEFRPLRSLQREINDLFEDVWNGGWSMPRLWGREEEGFAPAMDISETDAAITVKADLPGVSEKDVTVEVAEDVLTIRGEKKEEREEQGRMWRLSERSHGTFVRSFRLPAGVDAKNATATFEKGELAINLPRSAEAAPKVRKIELKSK